MSSSDWEEIRRSVIRIYRDCRKDGKDFLEAMTGLLWLERQRNESLCAAFLDYDPHPVDLEKTDD